jgi:hypothetical protein
MGQPLSQIWSVGIGRQLSIAGWIRTSREGLACLIAVRSYPSIHRTRPRAGPHPCYHLPKTAVRADTTANCSP